MSKIALGVLLALAAGSFLFLTDFIGSSEQSEIPAWEDTVFLANTIEEACSAVERFTGIPFKTRPSLRVQDAREAKEHLRSRLKPELLLWLDEDAVEEVESLNLDTGLGAYDPKTHVILLRASVVQALDGSGEWSPRNRIRLILVHEAAHAHHHDRFSWSPENGDWSQVDPDGILRAILEGYAEFVTSQVADDWELSGLNRARLAAIDVLFGEGVGRSSRGRAMADLMRHRYLGGLAFIEAVFRARGADGVEEVLRLPPADPRVIESPQLWLHPPEEKKISLRRPMEAFLPFVGQEGWRVTNRYQIRSLREFLLRPLFSKTGPELADACTDARLLRARAPGGSQNVNVTLFRFESEVWATTCIDALCPKPLVKALREGVPVAGREFGAGPAGSVYGVTQDREKTLETGEVVRALRQTFRFGDVVGIVRVQAVPSLDRADVDEAVERCTQLLAGNAD